MWYDPKFGNWMYYDPSPEILQKFYTIIEFSKIAGIKQDNTGFIDFKADENFNLIEFRGSRNHIDFVKDTWT